MQLNHKFCAMVACHLNFQFQVLTLLKRTKELGLVHFIVDVPKKVSKCILTIVTNLSHNCSFSYKCQ